MTNRSIIKAARKYTIATFSAVSMLFLFCGCAAVKSTNDVTASVSEERTDAEKTESLIPMTTPYDDPAIEISTSALGQQTPLEPNMFYGRLWEPFLILDSIINTSETIELDHGTPYVKLECNVHYCNRPNSELISAAPLGFTNRSAYDIDAIFIPLDIADEFTGHELIMLQVRPRIFDNSPIYVVLGDEKGNIAYWSFDNGKLNFPDSGLPEDLQQELTAEQRVFQSIYDINALVDNTNSLPPSHGDGRKAPMLKVHDGMTVQEVIDFFEAYKEWDEYLTEIYKNYIDAGIPVL